MELVETRIGTYVQKYRGAIVDDAWTCNGTHFYGGFGFYTTKVTVLKAGKEYYEEELALPLLSARPMSQGCNVEDKDFDEKDEASTFDAETRVRGLDDVFHF